MNETDWALYKRCPVCFREWSCVNIRIRWANSWPNGSGLHELKHPHRGRKKRETPKR